MIQTSTHLDWRGPDAEKAIMEGVADGIGDGSELVLTRSLQVVPVQSGTLARSGAAAVDRAALIATVSFSAPYAVAVHERMNVRHGSGRGPKYLERPFKDSTADIFNLVGAAVARRVA